MHRRDDCIRGARLPARGVGRGAGGGSARSPEYAAALFDQSRVHQIDIEIENWDSFIKNATREEYSPCAVTIDGERASGAGIRAKGNNSLRLTHKYGHSRYSLKIEFDHYVAGGNWRGLDKLSLDAAFQDNSYLKNFIAYGLMARLGVPTPLCSFAWVTVNGEPHGLFLAVEEPEESFALRNFGPAHGLLYKPDYRSLDDENADVALIYNGDDPRAYPGIFRRAKFPVSAADERRLISALKRLGDESSCASSVDIDLAARYFAAQDLRRKHGRLPRPDGPQLLPLRKRRSARDAAVGLQPRIRYIFARRAAPSERGAQFRQLPDRRACAA